MNMFKRCSYQLFDIRRSIDHRYNTSFVHYLDRVYAYVLQLQLTPVYFQTKAIIIRQVSAQSSRWP